MRALSVFVIALVLAACDSGGGGGGGDGATGIVGGPGTTLNEGVPPISAVWFGTATTPPRCRSPTRASTFPAGSPLVAVGTAITPQDPETMTVTVEISGNVRATLPLSPGGTGTTFGVFTPQNFAPGSYLISFRAPLVAASHRPASRSSRRPNGARRRSFPRTEAPERDIVPGGVSGSGVSARPRCREPGGDRTHDPGIKVPCSTELPARRRLSHVQIRHSGDRRGPPGGRLTPVLTPTSPSRRRSGRASRPPQKRSGAGAGRSPGSRPSSYARRARDLFERHPVGEERRDEGMSEIVQPERLDPCHR